MNSDGKRRKLEGGSAVSPVASLVQLDRFDSEILASHKQTDGFKVPGGLICTDHHFRTALDYSGEVSNFRRLEDRMAVGCIDGCKGLI